MATKDEETNAYELLSVALEATDQDIRTAYRKTSLKVHPDRNPNNPDAARKFHELKQAFELLQDPLRRMALDAKLRVKEARKTRFATYDAKRKGLVDELEERERAFKKQRMEKQEEEVERWRETESIKEQGRKLREDKERELKAREKEIAQATADKEDEEMDVPVLGALDTTVKLKYTTTTNPTLTTPAALAQLLSPFGPTDLDSIVLSIKPSKKAPTKPAKYATALVPFKQIGDAFAAVGASGRAERGLAGIDILWAEGKEPPILGWLRKMGKLGAPREVSASTAQSKAELPQMQPKANSSSFSTFPESFPSGPSEPTPSEMKPVRGIDYESLTLMRLRQAERERLEREIRKAEGE